MAYDRYFVYQSPSPCGRSNVRPPNDESHKGGLNTKLHLAVDSFGMPVRAIITDGTVADCSKTGELINGIDADYLLAGRGYDTDGVIEKVREAKMETVIPPKRNRKIQREYNHAIYENWHQIENTFLKLKRWQGIATRYAKKASSYMESVQIACLIL
ncbi:MAG: IS5 family transposase [Synergistaceae bacterium]|nr:IS5 family transposase [Synergistaceae bacterium]